MLNPAGLRRFPSPHLSLFSGFLVEFSGSNEEGRGVGSIKGVTPVAGGATGPPCRPRGGDRPPCRAHGPGRALGPAVARGGGDRPLSPVGGATGLFFLLGTSLRI